MITSSKQIDRYVTPTYAETSQEGVPVYLIASATMYSRAMWRRDNRAMGAERVSDEEIFESLRNGVREMVAAELKDTYYDLIDQWQHGDTSAMDEEEQKSFKSRIAFFTNEMQANYPPYAQLESKREYWMEIAVLNAVRHFLVGWENVDAEFRRINGTVPEDVLESIPPDDLYWIGLRGMAMMSPNWAEAKNSDGPSSSAGSPKRSAQAKKARGNSAASK